MVIVTQSSKIIFIYDVSSYGRTKTQYYLTPALHAILL